MAANPACERFIPQLSPYVDGELPPAERIHVERHLAACQDCTARTADLRAESGLLRAGLDLAADEVDFKQFTLDVMARITPEKPPFMERLRLSLSEMFLYQRTAMVSSLVTAVVVAVIALPLLLRDRTQMGYGAARMQVQVVRMHEEARVTPVVMEADNGSAIIWLVDRETPAPEATPPDEAHHEELEMDVNPETQGGNKAPAQPLLKEAPKGGAL